MRELAKPIREFPACGGIDFSPWLAVASAKAAEDDGGLIAKGANISGAGRMCTQRVEDNAFHLAAQLCASLESSL